MTHHFYLRLVIKLMVYCTEDIFRTYLCSISLYTFHYTSLLQSQTFLCEYSGLSVSYCVNTVLFSLFCLLHVLEQMSLLIALFYRCILLCHCNIEGNTTWLIHRIYLFIYLFDVCPDSELIMILFDHISPLSI